MRSKTLLFCLWLALPVLASAQSSVPEIQFDSVPDFFKLPVNMYFGEVAGIAVNSKHHIFVLSRGNTSGPAYAAAAAQLLEFDESGKFLREIGSHLYGWAYAHAVRIDRDDNIWVADKGSNVVVRFNPAGRVTMVFGRKPEASDENAHAIEHVKPPLAPIDGLFREVTDMTWDSDGNTYISEVRQGRQLGRFVRRARIRLGTVQHAALDSVRSAEPHLYRGSRQLAHPGHGHQRQDFADHPDQCAGAAERCAADR